MLTEKAELDRKPKRHHAIEAQVLPDGHAVLLSKQTDWAFTVTPLAALIWEFCDGTNSIADIITLLKEIPELSSYSVEQREVEQFVEDLDQAGFFEDFEPLAVSE